MLDGSNFKTATPNLVLSNGMRIYNIARTNSTTTFAIYVDIDGKRGDGIYGVDVYKFLLYVDGALLTYGSVADDTDYLKASVYYTDTNGTEIRALDVAGYKTAFCASLTDTQIAQTSISDLAAYCIGYSNNVNCKTSGCQIKILKPGF